MTEKTIIDCRRLACPQPVINTKNALQGATSPFVVMVDREEACINVSRLAQSHGAQVSVAEQGGEFHLTITPGQKAAMAEEPRIVCTGDKDGGAVVLISSEGMGRGDHELSAILMAAFVDTLGQFKGEISHVIFINAGAKLAIEGSPVLEQLLQLEQMGTRVLVCGTCLKHFGIKDRLVVGSVSNMYEIVETMLKASKIIQP